MSRHVALAFLLALAHCMSACSEPPPPCPKLECPPPPACPAVTQFDASNVQNPAARFAVETLQNLVNGNYESARTSFTPSLATELPATKLQSITHGHGSVRYRFQGFEMMPTEAAAKVPPKGRETATE